MCLFFQFQIPDGSIKVIWGYKGNVFGPVSGGTLILVHAPDGGLQALIDSRITVVLTSPGQPEKQCTVSTEVR